MNGTSDQNFDKHENLLARVVARLRKDEFTEQEIGTIFELIECKKYANSKVSTLKELAVQKGYLVEAENPPGKWNDAAHREVEEYLCQGSLTEMLRGFSQSLRSVRIFNSGSVGVLQSDWDQRLATFGKLAAVCLRELLQRAFFVGVSWGQTIEAVVEGLRDLDVGSLSVRAIQFIPMRGEPIGPERNKTSPSLLAQLASLILYGNDKSAVSIHPVGAVIPVTWQPGEQAVIWRYFEQCEPFLRIFGKRGMWTEKDDQLLINRVDTILTSVSSPDQPFKMFRDELVEVGKVDRALLSRLVFGDIGGCFLKRPGLGKKDLEEIERIEKCLPGTTLEHYRMIAKKAADSKGSKHGVIVFAIGAGKAAVVLEALKQDVINELVIDFDLARALWRETGGPVSGKKMEWTERVFGSVDQ